VENKHITVGWGMDDVFSVWSIWIDQPGHPGKHFVRRFEFPLSEDRGLSLELITDNLDAARSQLPPDLIRAKRSEREDPLLVEIWLPNPDDV
jgi:hypothetical protein